LRTSEFVRNRETLEQAEFAGRVAPFAGKVVASCAGRRDAASKEIMWTMRVSGLGGEFRLMILIIGRAVGETLDRDQGIVNDMKRLEASERGR
jgi:hypothetical protein